VSKRESVYQKGRQYVLTSFGHLLKALRLERGMTQKMLADEVGVDGSYIARLESDERRPSRRVVLDLARALQLSPDDGDRLLASAQHLPEGALERIIAQSGVSMTHPTIQAVANALQDRELSSQGREQLEAEITAYVAFRSQQLKQQDRDRQAMRAAHQQAAAERQQ
jgi:transcriptional regulator with XRE-family HTH domain